MNGYQPTSQFEQFVVDEMNHIKNHLRDLEQDVKRLTGFEHRLRGQASVLGAVFGTVSAWVLTIFKGHQ